MSQKTLLRTSFLFVFVVCSMFIVCMTSQAEAANEQAEDVFFDRLINGERILQVKNYETPQQPTVYLTFDDGPSEYTEEVLDLLKEEDIQATFFVLGQSVLRYPEITKRIASEGHAIGNHTYDHRYESIYSSFEGFWEQVKQTDDILQETVGIETRLLRAPGGTHTNFDPLYFYYLDQAGYEIYDWTVDSGDARRRGVPASEIIDNVKNGRLSHEMILLMHDSAGHAETVKALPEIIEFLKEKGYEFKPLTENVRPVHQSLGKIKWDRSSTLEQHKQTVNNMKQFADKTSVIPDQQETEDAADEPTPIKEEPSELINLPPLQLKIENSQNVLEITNHLLIEGRFYVPLRIWSEWRDGVIRWEQPKQTAYEQYGARTFEWMTSSRTVAMYDRPDHATMRESVFIQPSDLLLHDNRIYVPVREIAALHQLDIVDFAVQSDKREVVFKEKEQNHFERSVSHLRVNPRHHYSFKFTKLPNRWMNV